MNCPAPFLVRDPRTHVGQLRLPDVHALAVDKCDVDAAPQSIVEARREFEPACAAADDDDAVRLLVGAGRDVYSSRCMGRVSFSGTSSACTSVALITPSAWAVSAMVARLTSAVFATSAAFS